MAYTFLKAKGYEIGTSLLEEDKVEMTLALMKKAEEKGVEFLLPVDVVCADEFKNDSACGVYPADAMPADRMGSGHRTGDEKTLRRGSSQFPDRGMERTDGRI